MQIMAMVKLGHHGPRKLPGVSEGAQISIYKLRNRYGGIWEKIKNFVFFAFFMSILQNGMGMSPFVLFANFQIGVATASCEAKADEHAYLNQEPHCARKYG